MKHERDYEDETSPSEAHKKAQKMRMSFPHDRMTKLYENILNKEPEGYEEKLRANQVTDYYKSRGLFDMALQDVAFDLVMTDVSIVNLTQEEQLRRIETKLEQYATDPAYRSKYAGMAR